MTVRVGINGFGRIGRNFWRAVHAVLATPDIEIVAANDLGDIKTFAHLLKYDTVLGTLDVDVSAADGDVIVAGDQKIKVLAERDPAALPWGDLGVDVVIESTGHFTKRGGRAQAHRRRRQEGDHLGPGQGRGHHHRDGRQRRQATTRPRTTSSRTPPARPTASRRWPRCCSTSFGIVKGLMTTIHAYTNDQVILDFPHKDLRRARAAAQNIIPTTTGAAKATALVLPELKGKLDGMAHAGAGDGRVGHRPGRRSSSGRHRRTRSTRPTAAAADGPLQGYPALLPPTRSSPPTSSATPCSCTFDSLAHHGHRRPGEGHRLVRQRVGLLQPAGRPDRAGRPASLAR